MRVLDPQRGDRADYMQLVKKNAEQNLESFLVASGSDRRRASASALTELAAALDLPGSAAPHRVLRHLEHPRDELGRFDGRVRRRAAPKKSDYRHFKIQVRCKGRTTSR